MVLCCLFFVSISVTFHRLFLVRLRLLSGHLLAKRSVRGWRYVYLYVYLFPVSVLRTEFGF